MWRSLITDGKPGPKEWTKAFLTEGPPEEAKPGIALYARWQDEGYCRVKEMYVVTYNQGPAARTSKAASAAGGSEAKVFF